LIAAEHLNMQRSRSKEGGSDAASSSRKAKKGSSRCEAPYLHGRSCDGSGPECHPDYAETVIRALDCLEGKYRMTEGYPRQPIEASIYDFDDACKD